jgi:hypothetical protein
MKTGNQVISTACRRRLQTQGYLNLSDQELSEHHFGIRLAYWVCSILAIGALVAGNSWFVFAVAMIAFLATIPPYHPVDYIYNYGVRQMLGKSKLPPRTNQARFACGIASIWLIATAYFIANGQTLTGNILGFSLVAVGLLVASTDICIPSMMYNFLFLRNKVKHQG